MKQPLLNQRLKVKHYPGLFRVKDRGFSSFSAQLYLERHYFTKGDVNILLRRTAARGYVEMKMVDWGDKDLSTDYSDPNGSQVWLCKDSLLDIFGEVPEKFYFKIVRRETTS